MKYFLWILSVFFFLAAAPAAAQLQDQGSALFNNPSAPENPAGIPLSAPEAGKSLQRPATASQIQDYLHGSDELSVVQTAGATRKDANFLPYALLVILAALFAFVAVKGRPVASSSSQPAPSPRRR